MADTKQLLIELVLDNSKLKSALTEAEAHTKKKTSGMATTLGNLKAGWLAVIGAVIGVAKAIASSVKDYVESEKQQNRLLTALRNSNQATRENIDNLNKQSTALSRVTKFEDDSITALQTQLLQYGMTTKQIERATLATINLAEATGKDLSEAGLIVGKTFNTSTNGLAKFTDITVDAKNKSERFGQIMDGLDAKFKNAGISAGETFGGQLNILKNNIGNVKEDLGKAISVGIKPAIKAFNEFFASKKGGEDLQKVMRGLTVVMTILGSYVGFMIRYWIRGFGLVFDTFSNISKILNIIGEAIRNGDFTGVLKNIGDIAKNQIEAVKEVAVEFGKDLISTAKNTVDALKKPEEAITELGNTAEDTSSKILELSDDQKKLKTEAEALTKATLDGSKSTIQALDEQINKLEEYLLLPALEVEEQKKANEALKALRDKRKLEETKGVDEVAKAKIKSAQDVLSTVSDIEQQLFSIIDGIYNNQLQSLENKNADEMASLNATQTAEREALQKQFDDGLISAEDYENGLTALKEKQALEEKALQEKQDAETKKVKEKQWKAQKAGAIIDSIIKAAQAFMTGLTTGGLPLAIVYGALGAAQTAVIASQPMPKFSQGGVIDAVAPANISGEDGMIGAQLGESVLNKQATAMLGEDAINALNAGNSGAGGTSVIINVNGGDKTEVVRTLNDYFRKYGDSSRGLPL